MSTVVVRSLSSQVYELVRRRIVDGALPPHAPIRQDSLAIDLGVSKIPVREALTRLAEDGLVRAETNRGFIVSPLSESEAKDLFELRLQIEPKAARWASIRASDDDRVDAKAAVSHLNDGMEAGSPNLAQRNSEFHLALVRPSQRPVTVKIVERLQLLAERYVQLHLRPHGRDSRARLEHDDLFDAWNSGNGEAVERLLYDHISRTLSDLSVQLRIGA